ncbi:hypothetical protein RHSIM_Rhsim03G0159500 [Rhododendron simsii]|uniref:Uncharacterized protein n=1 Tax=Rhododendron simsii TaxID=118357 RepID=A0A834HAI2_RHOSS|nr:hypothetical protein RHSIM_Rhsim03G0159500 [Rhododendron simsii]
MTFSGKRPPPKFNTCAANSKCRKVPAICQFPPYWGDNAPRFDARSTGNSEVGEEGNIGVVVNTEPSEVECGTTKPMLSNANVEAPWQWMTVDNDVEVLVEAPAQYKPIDVPENITEAEPVTTLDISCEDTQVEDKEGENPILAGEKPNDLSVVPCVKINEDVTPSKVREVLNLFQETFKMLSNDDRAQAKGKRKTSWQFSLEAAELLKEQQKCVNTKKLSGPVPGVEIGDEFQFRAELVVIGLHRQLQAGIDYMEENGIKLATSIVQSGRYGNDAGEFPDVLIYSGQGGNPNIVDKPPEDQKLARGNLALKNSMDAGLPVRVILNTTRRLQTTYTYYGLYTVTQCRQERGDYGKLVYKFVLHRLAGQPVVNGAHVGMPKKSKVLKLPCVVADDVSQGKEEKPVRAVNFVDDEKLPPFHYVTNVIYPEWYESTHFVPRGCDCINGCLGFEKCPCTAVYGGDIPFTSEDAIVRRKPLIYECGPSCKCPPSCQNRVSQNGIRYHLEIFKTEKMGWGVRSRDFIQSGSFVCEYTGELLREQEAEERVGNDEYLFDIGKNGSGFTIDAARFGNVGRFINHSCSPNLYAQNVLYEHDDKRMPHIMFFAAKNIRPLRELTNDYNYKVDRVRDGNGDIKRKDCYCGSRSCSGRLY